jgi:hypothetical protein
MVLYELVTQDWRISFGMFSTDYLSTRSFEIYSVIGCNKLGLLIRLLGFNDVRPFSQRQRKCRKPKRRQRRNRRLEAWIFKTMKLLVLRMLRMPLAAMPGGRLIRARNC